ncbi:unnamed protein product [Leptidea sinapis]|uniref:unspecific monooxygenase n=2 Tax=Leptidea sinapis TaxID=189913 RepID=A0A5E4PYX5_9NEOP|nr:unnamed protein product [Leptidea sinapis]
MYLLQIILSEIKLLVIISFILIYVWFKYKFTYWARRNIPGPKPLFPFGNVRDVIRRKQQFFEPYCESYYKFKQFPCVGLYSFHVPVLSINDPDLAKHVLIKDFDYFQSHGIFSSGVGNPLGGHLFNIHGQAWKNLRLKLSPVFTSAKFKTMYPLVEQIANYALQYSDTVYQNGEAINFSDFYEKYSMEIVGSVGFGVECNGLKNNDSEFYQRGHEYFEPKSLYWTIIRAISFFAPEFFKKLRINRINPEINKFFFNLVKESVEYRQQHNYRRADFLEALIDLKNEGEKLKSNDTDTSDTFTLIDVAANTMLYMFAGYETSATTGQFAAYELARHPDIQARARDEILTVLQKHGGECTYEAQNEMTYLNMVLDETMRIHPPMRALFRRCTKDFRLPDSDVVIEEGTLVFIPIHSIQMDPDIFDDPQRFDPERFTPERKVKMHPCHWMPFGEGPRKCLEI